MSGCLYQEPLGPLVQDRCLRISCTRCLCQDPQEPGSTCARSVCADLLSKFSLSGSLHQDPVRQLAQELCLRICARSLCHDPVGPLGQDLCTRISCARSLCHDVCIRILCMRISCARCSGSPQQNPVGTLVQIGVRRSLLQDVCVKTSRDPVGPLAQDLNCFLLGNRGCQVHVKISAS